MEHVDKRCKRRNIEHPSMVDILPLEHQPYLSALLALRALNHMANRVS